MQRLFYVALYVTLTVSCIKSIEIYDDEDFAYVENEPNSGVNSIELNANDESLRNGRILWPYPLNNRNDSVKDEKTDAVENELHLSKLKNQSRKARFGHGYLQSPIMDMMLQTMGLNYSPTNAGDPFDFLRDSYPLPKGYDQPLEEYDYIIVGAGSAGSVIAARLTEEKPRATVLVLEAGKPEMVLSDIPALMNHIQRSDYVWPYTMEHQPGVCLGSEEERCYIPRGKAVGGTSVMNSMIYERGRPYDWDRIAAAGNYGWSYNEILPYYIKSERSELKKYKNKPYHGHDGELTVENVPFKTGLVEAFLAAGRSFGNPTIDYNDPDQLGFGYVQTISNKGHRLSSAKAFLHPHKRRKNLHVLTETKATKILIEPQTKRAYAVEYTRNYIKYSARVRREIILSAGPIASPQLLLLSGVGPKESLQPLGIPVINDLQVGKSLYDQISFPGIVFKLNTTNASLLEHKVATLPNFMQWLQFGDGLLTTPGGVEAIGYIKTSMSDITEPTPDVELISMGGSLTSDSGSTIRKSWKISDKMYHKSFGALKGADTWQAIPMLLHPKSKGYLELRDTNPFSHPKLFGNYLTDPRDLATLKEAVNYVIKLAESESFKKYDASLYLPPYPSCATHPSGSEIYWECAIRTMIVSMHNPVATCKMGPSTDPEAVVDPELRVYGVEGLRVADSSILPQTLSARTNTAEIMIGEKAADMIKKSWSNVIS